MYNNPGDVCVGKEQLDFWRALKSYPPNSSHSRTFGPFLSASMICFVRFNTATSFRSPISKIKHKKKTVTDQGFVLPAWKDVTGCLLERVWTDQHYFQSKIPKPLTNSYSAGVVSVGRSLTSLRRLTAPLIGFSHQ
ncbi:hypothetical protein CEXT_235121 [Caerostris extrusa]|uniref:Uncharacterized protein n=1 Tax=Caerostris extrusa TaxID=172846 RepID=A0AAV4NLH6_CAEEX|nr:hypothetical protein CEXT_235121 [Caerostris extrusa]